jgi:prepilin-type N-terminal cleavage/methylation domain-containing protein
MSDWIVTNRRREWKGGLGFSLIEMMVVVAVALILAAIVPPLMMNPINAIKLRYAAADLSGLIQQARIQSVKANTFYSIQQTTLATGDVAYYADLKNTGMVASGDPLIEMAGQVAVHAGPGSGAPGETAFITGTLKFTPDASGVFPRFNARGLPCVIVGSICQANGNGFVYFLNRVSNFGTSWAAVAVTPSGRAEVWSYDGVNWFQQ